MHPPKLTNTLPSQKTPTDFIYSEYLTTQRRPEFRQLVWGIATDYAAASLLLRLPGHVPMPAFQVPSFGGFWGCGLGVWVLVWVVVWVVLL
jgi:hypothetical protein